jgi:hypothetical protein
VLASEQLRRLRREIAGKGVGSGRMQGLAHTRDTTPRPLRTPERPDPPERRKVGARNRDTPGMRRRFARPAEAT